MSLAEIIYIKSNINIGYTGFLIKRNILDNHNFDFKRMFTVITMSRMINKAVLLIEHLKLTSIFDRSFVY